MKPGPILILLLAAAGCSNEPAPITPTEFFQQRAEATCSAISSACLITEASCVAGRVADSMDEYQNQLSKLRDFVPANAEACLRKVREVYGKLDQGAVALKANDYNAMETVCERVYRGTRSANESCAFDADCTDDLICDKGFCGIAKIVAPGAGCANIGETCPQGSYCSAGTGVWFCTPKAPTQTDCTLSPCLETLRCAAGICVARLGVGEPCASSEDCASTFCEPYAGRCADDIRFANGSAACIAMSANLLP
jgi:hypothetical protein